MKIRARCKRGHLQKPPNLAYYEYPNGKVYSRCRFCLRSARYELDHRKARYRLKFTSIEDDDYNEVAGTEMRTRIIRQWNEEAYKMWESSWIGNPDEDLSFQEWLFETREGCYNAGEPLPNCLQPFIAKEPA